MSWDEPLVRGPDRLRSVVQSPPAASRRETKTFGKLSGTINTGHANRFVRFLAMPPRRKRIADDRVWLESI